MLCRHLPGNLKTFGGQLVKVHYEGLISLHLLAYRTELHPVRSGVTSLMPLP